MHTESPIKDHYVMKEDDAIFYNLRQPRLEILLHGIVGMQTIDMQQIDRVIVELIHHARKVASNQLCIAVCIAYEL